MTWEVLTNDTEHVIERSVVRSAYTKPNKASPFYEDEKPKDKDTSDKEEDLVGASDSENSVADFSNKRMPIRCDKQKKTRMASKKQRRREKRRKSKSSETVGPLHDSVSNEIDKMIDQTGKSIEDEMWYDAEVEDNASEGDMVENKSVSGSLKINLTGSLRQESLSNYPRESALIETSLNLHIEIHHHKSLDRGATSVSLPDIVIW